MRGMTEQQITVERTEEGDKEKKKKRRSRRSKQNPAVSGSNDSSVSGIHMQESRCLSNNSTSNHVTLSMNVSSAQFYGLDVQTSHDNGLATASDVTFHSMPTMHINGETAAVELGSTQDEQLFPLTVLSKSCPEPICNEGKNGSFSNEDFLYFHKNEGYAGMQRKIYPLHWSIEAVNEAIEKGVTFRASFRVNAYNRLEAYCTIEGVPTDVLISGVVNQNRAVEGDIVAIAVDPPPFWTRLKGNSVPMDDCSVLPDVMGSLGENCKGKDKLDADYEDSSNGNVLLVPDMGLYDHERAFAGEAVNSELRLGARSFYCGSNGHCSSASGQAKVSCSPELNEVSNAVGKLCALISLFPPKRPTGRVVAIIESSRRRDAVVGFLGVKQWFSFKELNKKDTKKNKNSMTFSSREYIQLTPIDARLPKMTVSVKSLPGCIKKRLRDGDTMVEMELIGARIVDWREESYLPQANVMHILGHGGEIESQIAAILFQNSIHHDEFSTESLSCLPNIPWEVPGEELERRKDLRNLCIFTIDPSSASDLDDALSVEKLSNDIFRVGVHIADVSVFVLPGTALDIEAQMRSTSVYLLQHKVPMLPPLLSENLGSLIPGADRLAFSIFWDIDLCGNILDRWIGRTVIRSCCKLSYDHVQYIIDGSINVENLRALENGWPALHGQFDWHDVVRSVKILNEISVTLKDNRFKDGALHLESSKLVFLFDECGIPYDSILYEQKDSNFLVEEFMLLANRTAAEVISRAFPDCALLRRHPEPNLRRLKEFEAFWRKHGLEVDTSSSAQLQLSLWKIREKLKNDPVLFDVLMSYASKPMQLAAYFCTGDLKDKENEWAHYSLAVPLYTHFTSPLRRYADIVVHRTLAAAIEAEDLYLKQQKVQQLKLIKGKDIKQKCVTGIYFDKDVVESKECREALSAAALTYRVPCAEMLIDVAAYCNERMLASRHAEDAGDKLLLWVLLKKKETLTLEAKVMGLGPKFMSIYIHKLAIERRIYYDDVDGLTAEWLETTSTLVLDLCKNKRSQKRGSPGKCRAVEDVARVISSCDLKPNQFDFESSAPEEGTNQGAEAIHVASEEPGPGFNPGISDASEIEPGVFPITVQIFSIVPVALHANGGDDGPLDIGARLYMTSYFG
ncbi:DIS3-like exonuclease 2 [Telopea speciosissima]|uniref:DIS3-like exonuclease 2 n=1 Tax=Telopea speciosissima TaxID=54955 RepID=UPI001CC68C22|nr:DIS3-like exonuclease 2 [Telopea speciosissima]XP_043712655.1 DIS3-like exonuclease 2 [Telopea speciosissima]